MSPLLATALVYNALVVLGLVLMGWGRPRFLLHSAPEALKAAAPALTPVEVKELKLRSVPLMVVLFGLPLGFLLWSGLTGGADFVRLWTEAALLLLSFNLFDLLVIDGLVLCWWTPSFLVIPGTEGNPGYKDFGFHLRGFAKGTVVLTVAATGLTLVAWTVAATILGA